MVKSARNLNKWPINQSNVHNVFILMDTVLSCEYSELSYSFIQYTETNLLECKQRFELTKLSSTVFDRYKTCTKNVFEELRSMLVHISNMIFTLVEFTKYKMYIVFSKQDIMKILLTWYLQLKRYKSCTHFPPLIEEEAKYNNEGKEVNIPLYVNSEIEKRDVIRIENVIETMIVVGSQIKIALKEFITQSCRSRPEFNEFSKYVSDQIQNKDFSEILDIIRQVPYYLKTCVCSDKFGLNGSLYDNNLRLKYFLKIIKLNKNITVEWNKEEWIPIETIYNNHVEHTKSLQTILKYDKFVIGLMTKLVYAKVHHKCNTVP